MLSLNSSARLALAALLASLMVLPACSVNVKDGTKSKDGSAQVDIKSPFGDVHVDEQPDIRAAGLTMYPGAKPAPKQNSEEKKNANVNISVPGFELKVVAGEFISDDPPDKVIAFYNKDLSRFGKTVQCQGRWTGADANVNPDKHDGFSKPVACGKESSGDSVEIKVGTEGNQHIAAVKPDGKGSRFALVYVRARTGKDDTI
jgi:hypothetical protein